VTEEAGACGYGDVGRGGDLSLNARPASQNLKGHPRLEAHFSSSPKEEKR